MATRPSRTGSWPKPKKMGVVAVGLTDEFVFLLWLLISLSPIIKPLLSGGKAGPAGHISSQIYGFPKWATRRLVKLIDFRKKGIDEFRCPFVSERVFWPI